MFEQRGRRCELASDGDEEVWGHNLASDGDGEDYAYNDIGEGLFVAENDRGSSRRWVNFYERV